MHEHSPLGDGVFRMGRMKYFGSGDAMTRPPQIIKKLTLWSFF
jgi:hypothetical protein